MRLARRLESALAILLIACSSTSGEEASAPTTPVLPSTSIPGSSTTIPVAPRTTTSAPAPGRMLVFHETVGFRHDSIQAGIAALTAIGEDLGLETVTSADSSAAFGPDLASYRVIVFLNTTGDVLEDDEQAAMEAFVDDGGGFVGIHSATDTEYEWPWYGGLVGAYFADHPAVQPATMHSTESGHPAGAGLPPSVDRVDEWYNFRAPPGPDVVILATLDESTYQGGTMGPSHPIAWAHQYEGGRAFYTAGGHTIESYVEPVFTAHIAAGVAWAAGMS